MLYLYAITEAGVDVPAANGIDGRPLRPVVEGALAAVCSEHAAAPAASTEAVRRHAAIVEALAERGPVLPARFGEAFGDEHRLRSALAERAVELVPALDRVRGRVEVGVRVLGRAPKSAAAPTDGRAYLLGRLDHRRRTAELAEKLHGALSSVAVAASMQVDPAPRVLLSAAYLVDGDAVAPFRDRVEALATERPDLDVVCTGPWPPYSFTGAEEGAA